MYSKLPTFLQLIFWPWVWSHEYCHYWTARRLGRLAKIEGARTYVHQVTLVQHMLIAIAPTIPNLFLVGFALFGYQTLANNALERKIWGAGVALTAVLLFSCALDWWVIIKGLVDPAFLNADSAAILIVSPSAAHKNRSLRRRLESSGYFLSWAVTGSAAVAALRRNRFDLIIIDPRVVDLDVNNIWMEVSIHQGVTAPKIVALRSPGELAQLPLYLEIGLPQDQFIS